MIGLTYVLIASGLTIVFGILRIVNFAHGQFYMIGAICLYWLYSVIGLSYFFAMFLSMIAVAIIGLAVEFILLKRLQSSSILASLGVVLGLLVGIAGLMELLFGEGIRNVKSAFLGVVDLWSFRLPTERLAIICAALLIITVLFVWIKYTRNGMATRAMAQERRAAALVGVDVENIRYIVMGIGSALAGAAGALVAPLFFVSAHMGTDPMLKSLIIITLGGMGSLPGAVLGGLILGFIEGFGYLYIGNLTEMFEFMLVIVILLVRPQGLFGVPFEIAE
jgi:branched-chain amino acid transport system permease protein